MKGPRKLDMATHLAAKVLGVSPDLLTKNHKEVRAYMRLTWPELALKYRGIGGKERETQRCRCGKPGTQRKEGGLSCGIHCDRCFDEMVNQCRSRSW